MYMKRLQTNKRVKFCSGRILNPFYIVHNGANSYFEMLCGSISLNRRPQSAGLRVICGQTGIKS